NAITPNTIEEAEKLAGIEFTPRKRETIARTIRGQVRRVKHRQSMPLPPNELAPALTFDPRLPGMKFDREQRPIVRGPAPSPLPLVPASDEDIAFSPLTLL